MFLRIITFRDPESPILFKPAQKIESFGEELAKIARDMEETIISVDALGLAAPQINKNIAVCTIKFGKEIHFFCNPEITEKSFESEKAEEGCLSFPNVFLEIPRAKKIKITYQDLEGNFKKLEACDLLARTLQHEIDHLNGIVFIEKA